MKKILMELFFLLIFLFFISSCAFKNNYYAPDEGNMLKLVDKNDLKISGSVGNEFFYENNYIENFQLGYSPIKHLGLFGNYSRNSENDFNNNDLTSFGNIKYNSGAIGTYYLFQTKKQKFRTDSLNIIPSGFLIDAYLGYGGGKSRNNFIEEGFITANFDKKFAQLGLHWQDEFIGFSSTIKFGKLNYHEMYKDGQISNRAELAFNKLSSLNEFSIIETSLKGFVGPSKGRIYLGFTSTYIEQKNRFDYKNFYFSLGLLLNIDNIFSSISRKSFN